MRIRIALTLGALVLAGGALSGGIALASEAQPPAPTSTRPNVPTTAPTSTRPNVPTTAPAPDRTTPLSAAPATTLPPRTGPAPRVPRAVPAGPTGDLHLPAVWETR